MFSFVASEEIDTKWAPDSEICKRCQELWNLNEELLKQLKTISDHGQKVCKKDTPEYNEKACEDAKKKHEDVSKRQSEVAKQWNELQCERCQLAEWSNVHNGQSGISEVFHNVWPHFVEPVDEHCPVLDSRIQQIVLICKSQHEDEARQVQCIADHLHGDIQRIPFPDDSEDEWVCRHYTVCMHKALVFLGVKDPHMCSAWNGEGHMWNEYTDVCGERCAVDVYNETRIGGGHEEEEPAPEIPDDWFKTPECSQKDIKISCYDPGAPYIKLDSKQIHDGCWEHVKGLVNLDTRFWDEKWKLDESEFNACFHACRANTERICLTQ